MTANPMEVLNRLKVRGDLTPEEEVAIKLAIEHAMSQVDTALRVVLAMIEEIDNRKNQGAGANGQPTTQ
jgi:hypothetical protein